MKEKTYNVSETVDALLDQAKAENRPLPTLRALRAQIGGGSLTTISEAVKNWRLKELQAVEGLPQGFDKKTAAEIAEAVWNAALPVLKKRVDEVRKNAAEQIETERQEAAKLSAAAADALAEASSMNEELSASQAREQELREALAKAEGELEELRKTLSATQRELATLRAQYDELMKDAVSVSSAMHAMSEMLPFVDPKHFNPLRAGE